jgi:hypothetical protein
VRASIQREYVPDKGLAISFIRVVGIGWQRIEIEPNLAE